MFWWTKVVFYIVLFVCCRYRCCRRRCWLTLKHVLNLCCFISLLFSSLPTWTPTPQTVALDLWFRCCACVAGFVLTFSWKAVLWTITVRFTEVLRLSLHCISVLFATLCAASLLVCRPLCLAHIKIVFCGFWGKKNILLQFQCEITTNLFFQHNCLLNNSSKKCLF